MTRELPGSVRVSVVIPTYNAASVLPEQLEALARQTTSEPFEVIVSDNGSTDGLVSLLTEWQERVPYALRRVDASGRQGVSHARNVGVLASEGEFVLVCDADDAVHPGWIDGHVTALASADVTGGPTEVEKLNPGPERFWREFPPIGDDWKLPEERAFLPWITGANFGARRSVIEALGGWDEDLDGLGGDDLDFSWRAQLQGFTVGAAPSAIVSYRLRPGLRATARQVYHYTVCLAPLWERFAADGLPPAKMRRAAAALVHMVFRRAHHLGRGDLARALWMVNVASAYGVFMAAIRYNLRGRRQVGWGDTLRNWTLLKSSRTADPRAI